MHEHNTIYLLPVQGSDTKWYKNLVAHPTLKISVNGIETSEKGKLVVDGNSVDDIVKKFRSKFGEWDVKNIIRKPM